MIEQGYRVTAMDLADTSPWYFLQWRKDYEHLSDERLSLRSFLTAVPEEDLPAPVDGAVMISVIDHCWDPWGTLRWVTRQVKPGGFLVLDNYNTEAHPDEPQHLCRFDNITFIGEMLRLGWQAEHESPYLFTKTR
jgi:hypothetical protein